MINCFKPATFFFGTHKTHLFPPLITFLTGYNKLPQPRPAFEAAKNDQGTHKTQLYLTLV